MLRERGYKQFLFPGRPVQIILINCPGSFKQKGIVLFLGELYRWAQLNANNIESSILDAVGWREKMFTNKPIDFAQVKTWQETFLNYLENSGYPFARVYLDSLQLEKDKVTALLKINKGPAYKIDIAKKNYFV